jgi:hypothetical protein
MVLPQSERYTIRITTVLLSSGQTGTTLRLSAISQKHNKALQPTPGDRRGPSEARGRARLTLCRSGGLRAALPQASALE